MNIPSPEGVTLNANASFGTGAGYVDLPAKYDHELIPAVHDTMRFAVESQFKGATFTKKLRAGACAIAAVAFSVYTIPSAQAYVRHHHHHHHVAHRNDQGHVARDGSNGNVSSVGQDPCANCIAPNSLMMNKLGVTTNTGRKYNGP
jgi:hypothetical protein